MGVGEDERGERGRTDEGGVGCGWFFFLSSCKNIYFSHLRKKNEILVISNYLYHIANYFIIGV